MDKPILSYQMQSVIGAIRYVGFAYGQDPQVMRLLPYIGLYVAGFKTLDQLPPAVAPVIARLDLQAPAN